MSSSSPLLRALVALSALLLACSLLPAVDGRLREGECEGTRSIQACTPLLAATCLHYSRHLPLFCSVLSCELTRSGWLACCCVCVVRLSLFLPFPSLQCV